MAINAVQHRKHITQKAIARFSDDKPLQLGFEGFFKTETTTAKRVSIEVERNLQKIAVDVQRSTDANRNTFSNSSEKIFEPPFFNETFDITELENYDLTFARGVNPTAGLTAMMVEESTKRLGTMKKTIQRAYELQRSQVLQTGIVTLTNGDNIDFKRQALSIVVKTAGDAWSAPSTSDPLADIELGCEFLRTEGLSVDGDVNMIMGQASFNSFLANDKIEKLGDFRRFNRIDIHMPQFDKATGMVSQGKFGVGDYTVFVWTYNSMYDNENNVKTRYLDTDTVILLPADFEGIQSFAGVPVIDNEMVIFENGAYVVGDRLDEIKTSHYFWIKSAGVSIPLSVDRIYTIKVQ